MSLSYIVINVEIIGPFTQWNLICDRDDQKYLIHSCNLHWAQFILYFYFWKLFSDIHVCNICFIKTKKKKPNKSICIYNVRATHLASDRILTYIHLRARILTPHCDDHHFHFQLIGGVCATLCYIKTHIYINPYGGVWVHVCVCACYWRQISYYDAERCGAFKLL